MQNIIIRHRKENRKKCSLRGLENDPRFCFYTYPLEKPIDFGDATLLKVDAPLLTRADAPYPLLLLDGTWRYAGKMAENLLLPKRARSLPSELETAYPRRQDQPNGLSSIEALYVALLILGRDCEGLLDNYHWKEAFLEINRAVLLEYS